MVPSTAAVRSRETDVAGILRACSTNWYDETARISREDSRYSKEV